MHIDSSKIGADSGARLAIRLLQDAALRGDLDPWDVDVIPVVDGFLDQLNSRIEKLSLFQERSNKYGGSYEKELADSSEAFLAASVLVGLKADVLEIEMFPAEPDVDELSDFEIGQQGWLDSSFEMPSRPEKHLVRRAVAPPPLRRPVTLGELIEQLESIAEQLESDQIRGSRSRKIKKYSDREAIAQVTALAHREKLPETTAALGMFLNNWEVALHWVDFDSLVSHWERIAKPDLDTDRVGVFWALLFLCSQGKLELQQEGTLFSPLQLKRILEPGSVAQLPLHSVDVPAVSPAAA